MMQSSGSDSAEYGPDEVELLNEASLDQSPGRASSVSIIRAGTGARSDCYPVRLTLCAKKNQRYLRPDLNGI